MGVGVGRCGGATMLGGAPERLSHDEGVKPQGRADGGVARRERGNSDGAARRRGS